MPGYTKTARLVGVCLLTALATGLPQFTAQAQTSDTQTWQPLVTGDGSQPTARHESGAVAVNGKLYLLGGRGQRPLDVYDPAQDSWAQLGNLPMELHHFQPVASGNTILVAGAFTCCYPNEVLVEQIHAYNIASGQWSTPYSFPAGRARGSAAALVRNNKLYVIGGNTQGHSGGAVAWFDELDLDTGQWTTLADAPNKRDHFSAVLIGDQLVASSGRQTAQPDVFGNAVAATDIYDFSKNTWRTVSDIPTLRAGAVAAGAGDEVIVIGGEISGQPDALDTVEALNAYTGTWRTLQPLGTGRHSGGAALLGEQVHVIAGSLRAGGAPESSAHEVLNVDTSAQNDTDGDGLPDSVETTLHGTDPANADSDSDGLSDGVEITTGTNPLEADSDGDTVKDGDEVNIHPTDPTLFDTDGDGLSDGVELSNTNTSAVNPDSDNDGLNDGDEIDAGTDPANPDSDGDGIPDGDDDEPMSAASGSGGGSILWLMLALLGAVLVGSLSRRRLFFVN